MKVELCVCLYTISMLFKFVNLIFTLPTKIKFERKVSLWKLTDTSKSIQISYTKGIALRKTVTWKFTKDFFVTA